MTLKNHGVITVNQKRSSFLLPVTEIEGEIGEIVNAALRESDRVTNATLMSGHLKRIVKEIGTRIGNQNASASETEMIATSNVNGTIVKGKRIAIVTETAKTAIVMAARNAIAEPTIGTAASIPIGMRTGIGIGTRTGSASAPARRDGTGTTRNSWTASAALVTTPIANAVTERNGRSAGTALRGRMAIVISQKKRRITTITRTTSKTTPMTSKLTTYV